MTSFLLRIIYVSAFIGIHAVVDIRDDIEIMIEEERYPVEKHYVTTEDNFILGLHRIPTKISYDNRVVLIIHGLMASASDYLVFGRNNSLGYLVSDAGYDVWLGNARGTSFSRNHTTLDPDTSAEFWNYSFHEIGIFDLPAIIDYVLKVTEQPWLQYIGHSQGCTAFFVMAAERPDYVRKVRSMHGMAPAVFLPKSQFVFQFVLDFMDHLEILSKQINVYEISADRPEIREYLTRFAPLCQKKLNLQKLCVELFFTNFGTSVPQPLAKRMARHMLHNSPNIVSLKQLLHFGQIIKSNRFQKFDYKDAANLRIYAQSEPPVYDLSKINTSLYIHYGLNDLTTPPNGIQILVDTCDTSVTRVYPVTGFNHLDFVFSKHAKTSVYDRLIKDLGKY